MRTRAGKDKLEDKLVHAYCPETGKVEIFAPIVVEGKLTYTRAPEAVAAFQGPRAQLKLTKRRAVESKVCGIEELVDGWRFHDVLLHDGRYNIDLAMTPLPKHTPEQHARYAKKAGAECYRAASAPHVYAVFKRIAEHLARPNYPAIVDDARDFLRQYFKDTGFRTLTVARYVGDGANQVVQDWRLPTQRASPASLTGMGGHLLEDEETLVSNKVPDDYRSNAESYLRAIFDTTDDALTLDAVITSVIGHGPYVAPGGFPSNVPVKPTDVEECGVLLFVCHDYDEDQSWFEVNTRCQDGDDKEHAIGIKLTKTGELPKPAVPNPKAL